MRVPKSGGATSVVAEGTFSFAQGPIAVSGSNVYFIAWAPGGTTLYRAAKRGGAAPVARVTSDSLWQLAPLGECIVYSSEASIQIVSKY